MFDHLQKITLKTPIEVWLSLVERYVRDVEVASSNLVISTKKTKDTHMGVFCFLIAHGRSNPGLLYPEQLKLYHRALCLERDRSQCEMKGARQGRKQGV